MAEPKEDNELARRKQLNELWQLKARAYDLISTLEQVRVELTAVNQQIAALQAKLNE